MPEGPSLVILKELVQPFKNKKVIAVGGNTKLDVTPFAGKKIIDFKTWGKHFLICFSKGTIRIHLMLFGSYTINEQKATPPRLSLAFQNGTLYFYTCSIKIIDEPLDNIYDWSADIMSDAWDAKAAIEKLTQHPDTMVCDALLMQDIFSGSGNIIKNEVLFRVKVHPESLLGNVAKSKLKALVTETRKYAFDFYNWKKAYVLRKHWKVHTKKICPDCERPLTKTYSGKFKRRSFYCENCQILY